MSSDQATKEVLDPKEELQSNYLLPSVAQFVSLYRFAFKLPEIEIEELEDGILEKNEVGGKVLQDLLVALLKGVMPGRGINPSNLEEHLQKVLRKFWQQEKKEEYPFPEEATFSQIDIPCKVDLLHYLCCLRVDRADAQEAMKTMDAEALRVQPLGNDEEGNEYWYFFGTRLYKQEPAKEKTKNWEDEWKHQKDVSFSKRGRGRPRKAKQRKSDGESDDFEDVPVGKHGRYMNIDEKSRWSVVCNTIEDWVDFAEKLKGSKSKSEKALFQTVTDNFLPVLNEIYQEKERRLQQKLRELVPRRVITRRETRGQRIKSVQDMNGYDAETAHREHLARNRAQRLEERNRRVSQGTERSKSRSRRSKYTEEDDDDDFDDYPDEDDFREVDVESAQASDDSNEYRKEYVPVITGDSADLKSQVLKVLSEVKLQKDAWPFLYPVDEAYAPGYYEIINDPMDLSTMSTKLLDNAYKTIGHIDEDFKKMVDNCKLYNGENSGMSSMVMNLWRVFRRGMAKIGNPSSEHPKNARSSEPTISRMTEFPQTTENDGSNDFQMKRSSESQGKKKKKRIKHMDALEILSEQAKIAVEQSQNTDADSQPPSQYNMYSDLKIVPIHNHPTALIEKFSDSSNQEMDDLDSSNASASSYSEKPQDDTEKEPQYIPQNEDSSDLSEFIDKNAGKGFNILSDGEGNNPSIMSDDNEDLAPGSSTPYERSAKMMPNNDGLAQNEVLDDNVLNGLPREMVYGVDGQRISPAGNFVDGQRRSPQQSVSPFSNIVPAGSDTTVDVPQMQRQNVSPQQNVPTFTNIPHGGRNAVDLQQMQRPNLSNELPAGNRKSPPQTMPFNIASARNPNALQEQPQNNPGELTTVDISALGMPHIEYLNKQTDAATTLNQNSEHYPSNPFSKVPSPQSKPRYSPNQSVDFQPFQTQRPEVFGQRPNLSPPFDQRLRPETHNQQTQRPNVQNYDQRQNFSSTYDPQRPNLSPTNSVATFTTHMQPQQPNTSTLMQVPPHLSKMFHNPGKVPTGVPGQMMLQPGNEPGKFPTMKVSLPPSTGELLVVPGDPANNTGMTFHLFAQPHASMAQPIQSRLQIFADGTSQHQSNVTESQFPTAMRRPTNDNDKTKDNQPPPPKRKSPVVQYLQPSIPTTTVTPTTATQNVTFTASNGAPPLIRPSALRHQIPPVDNNTRPQNPFLQTTNVPYTICSTQGSLSATTMGGPVFPTYSYRQASVNGGTVTTNSNSITVKPNRVNVQRVFQNGNGQFVLMPPPQQTKDAVKMLPSEEMGQRRNETVTSAPFYPAANNMFTLQTASGNTSQVYAQVLPNQLPQYVNQGTPYYIVTDPNSLQNPQRYPLMNMQPIPFPNR